MGSRERRMIYIRIVKIAILAFSDRFYADFFNCLFLFGRVTGKQNSDKTRSVCGRLQIRQACDRETKLTADSAGYLRRSVSRWIGSIGQGEQAIRPTRQFHQRSHFTEDAITSFCHWEITVLVNINRQRKLLVDYTGRVIYLDKNISHFGK